MRIAVVATSFPRHSEDAAGHFVAAEARALARSGAEVTLVVPGSAPHGPTATEQNLSVHWVGDGGAFGWPGVLARLRGNPARTLGAVQFCRSAERLLRETGPYDRVVAHWILPSGWPIAAGLPGKIEVVAHGGDVQLLVRLPALVRRRILRVLLDRGVTFRFVSSELLRLLVQSSFDELRAVSRVEPCLIDVSHAPSRVQARQELGIGAREVWIVIVGRLVPGKRIEVALRAATLVPDAKIAVIGDGPELARLTRRHEQRAVRFLGLLGRRSALTWIAASDLLLTASRREGAPTVVREARALGVPVIASACGDLVAWAAADPGLHVTGLRLNAPRG